MGTTSPWGPREMLHTQLVRVGLTCKRGVVFSDEENVAAVEIKEYFYGHRPVEY